MGGIMSIYAGVHYNQWFSKAACVSSAIGFCMGPLMRDIRASKVSPDSRFFLSWGTNEAHGIKNPDQDDRSSKTYRWNKRAADAIAASGAAVQMYCQVGGHHCEADWEKQNPLYMDFLWKE
jgi:predicted alpha/beta superfamily hydrolase